MAFTDRGNTLSIDVVTVFAGTHERLKCPYRAHRSLCSLSALKTMVGGSLSSTCRAPPRSGCRVSHQMAWVNVVDVNSRQWILAVRSSAV